MLKKGIFRKIFGLAISVSFIVGVFILAFSLKEVTIILEQSLIQENKLLIESVARIVETGYIQGFFPFKILGETSQSENILFLWVVKPDGKIYYADDLEMWGKVIEDPFLAKEELMIRDIIDSKTGQRIKLISHPAHREIGEKPWTLFLGVSSELVKSAQKNIIFLSLGVFLLTIFFIVLISFYFSKRITRPLEELRRGAEIIGKGNLEHQIEIKTGDEIEELGKTFNQMTEDLRHSCAALEEAKTVLEIKVRARTRALEEERVFLEEKVEQRTKEIQEKMEELERFNKLAVGRELKMVALKEEIEKLKKELEAKKGRE